MELLEYLRGVFSGWNLLILIGGTVVGLLLGATPGLSPTMAVALLIPFTFHMEATAGLILLGSLYTSTVAGGAVSASPKATPAPNVVARSTSIRLRIRTGGT